MKEIDTEENVIAETAGETQSAWSGFLNRKTVKKLILLNGIVVGVLLVAGVIYALVAQRTVPAHTLAAENQKLQEEIKRLQELPPATGEKNPEVMRVEKLVARLQPRLGAALTEPIAVAVVNAALQHDLPAELILSIIYYESEFEVTAESEDGSAGLMQISPKVYRSRLSQFGITEQEAFHINNNINLGCSLLREFLDQGESIELALAKLVGSPSRVDDILVGFTNTMIATPPGTEVASAETDATEDFAGENPSEDH